jgi:hypothetical protein
LILETKLCYNIKKHYRKEDIIMQNQRENLINIIARCNSKQVKRQWIHEMVSLTDIECAENQCTGCSIESDCIEVCNIN